LRVFQLIEESNGDQQKVYFLLRANLDKLDTHLTEVLRGWAKDKLSQVQSEEAQRIVRMKGEAYPR
jgi:hypothetical protein